MLRLELVSNVEQGTIPTDNVKWQKAINWQNAFTVESKDTSPENVRKMKRGCTDKEDLALDVVQLDTL